MAKLTGAVELPERDYRNYFTNRQAGVVDPHDAAFQKLVDRAKALPPGTIEGALLKFPAADGYAYYLVSKDNGRTVEVKHVPYSDAWQVHPALIRGLRRADILRMVEGERHFAKLFAEKVG